MNDKKIDILGYGCISVDEILYVDHYPKIDEKISVLNKLKEVGGLTGRALITASNLGAKCAYSGTLGKCDLSTFILDTLISLKMNVDDVQQIEEAGPIHSISVVSEHDSSRNVFYDIKNWEKGIDYKKLDSELIKSSKLLLIDNFIGISNAILAAKTANNFSIPIVADIEHKNHEDVVELLNMIDHLIISESFAEKLTGYSDPILSIKNLWDDRKKILAITCGKNGCWYKGYENMKIQYHPAEKVSSIDTTGCGDVFHGAYAYALARNYELIERVELATKMASIKAQGKMPNKTHL